MRVSTIFPSDKRIPNAVLSDVCMCTKCINQPVSGVHTFPSKGISAVLLGIDLEGNLISELEILHSIKNFQSKLLEVFVATILMLVCIEDDDVALKQGCGVSHGYVVNVVLTPPGERREGNPSASSLPDVKSDEKNWGRGSSTAQPYTAGRTPRVEEPGAEASHGFDTAAWFGCAVAQRWAGLRLLLLQ